MGHAKVMGGIIIPLIRKYTCPSQGRLCHLLRDSHGTLLTLSCAQSELGKTQLLLSLFSSFFLCPKPERILSGANTKLHLYPLPPPYGCLLPRACLLTSLAKHTSLIPRAWLAFFLFSISLSCFDSSPLLPSQLCHCLSSFSVSSPSLPPSFLSPRPLSFSSRLRIF